MTSLQKVAVGGMIVALLLAVPLTAIVIDVAAGDNPHYVPAAMPMGGVHSGAMSGMMGSQTGASPTAPADQLTILHVQRGCHVWSNGRAQSATMHLTMRPGQMLQIMNQDLDMHRMMELSGPAMMLGPPMREGQAETLDFTKPGTYRFDTEVLPMKGMPEVETIGPDNTLRLLVTVG